MAGLYTALLRRGYAMELRVLPINAPELQHRVLVMVREVAA